MRATTDEVKPFPTDWNQLKMMKSRRTWKSRKSLVVIAGAAAVCLGLGLGTAPASAAESDTTQAESALSEFRTSLVERAAADPSTAADVSQFDSLSDAQRAELAAYFLGESDSVGSEPTVDAAVEVDGNTTVYTDGDFAWTTTEAAGNVAARAVTKSVWANQWFSFAGITISETKVSGTYTVSGGNATSVNSYACTVVQNIDPFSQVSSSKNAGYVAGGQANLKCKVTVKRGVPTPWGPVSWSTKESIQYLRANGAGNVVSHGWQ